MKFAHISDLHIGKSWMFDKELLEMAIDIINGSDAEAVLITGDLTDWGLASEYESVMEYLDRIEKDIYVVPGNHDARIAGYKVFERLFCEKRGRFFSEAMGDVLLIGLDSAEPDIDDGHIGREQLSWLDKVLGTNLNKKVVIVAMHHHLVPVPNTGRERNILIDANEVLEVLNERGVPLVVTGHKHNPWLWRLNGTYIYSGGTVSCKRTAVPNAMSFIYADYERIRITKIEIPTKNEVRVLEHRW